MPAISAQAIPADSDPGLRELGKMERERRIKEAAKAVFSENGYDEATTREIARRAAVSIGTIFVYARDKRDLLFLVFNDELDPIADLARLHLPESRPALDRMCALAKPWYEYFAANVALGRYAFREMTFYEPQSRDFGKQCERYRRRMNRIESWFCEIVRDGRNSGELVFDDAVSTVGNLVYLIYLAEIRNWIQGPDPRPVVGIKSLRAKLAILLRGLKPAVGRRKTR